MIEAVQKSDHQPRLCAFCGGSGRCAKCHGLGQRTIHKRWPRRDETVECWACDGSGTCGLCHGEGEAAS